MYKKLMGTYDKVHWDKYVWCRMLIPKHRFLLWLVMHNRMQTAMRLHKFGICTHPRCIICDSEEETREPLFFNCCFSAAVLEEIRCWLGLTNTSKNVQRMIRGICYKFGSNSLSYMVD